MFFCPCCKRLCTPVVSKKFYFCFPFIVIFLSMKCGILFVLIFLKGDRASKKLFYYCPVCYHGPGTWAWAFGGCHTLTLSIPKEDAGNSQVNDVAQGKHGYKGEVEEINDGEVASVEWAFSNCHCSKKVKGKTCTGKFDPEQYNYHPTLTSSSRFTTDEEDILEHVIVQNVLDDVTIGRKEGWCRSCNNNVPIASYQHNSNKMVPHKYGTQKLVCISICTVCKAKWISGRWD